MDGVQAALAASPIALVLLLMVVGRWSAARAGAAGLAAAALLAPTLFDLGDGLPGGTVAGFAGVLAEGLFTSMTILWILWPALALYEVQRESGALDTIRNGLRGLSERSGIQVLLVGWFLSLFLEGAAGFGTPVALTAPLLVGLGVAPVQAVVLSLLGHAVGVSFGALGTPVLAQVALTGLDPMALAWRAALLHTLLGGLMMFFFHRAQPAGGEPAWAAVAAAAFLLPSLALAWLLGPELPTLGSALVGGVFFALLVRRQAPPRNAASGAPALLRALWPYLLLVLLVIATRALPGVSSALGSIALEWRWHERFSGRMAWLVHPGTLLFIALVLGARLQGAGLRALHGPLGRSARRLVPVTAALVAMLCLSRLMVHAGMIDAIQAAAVRGVGHWWPLVAPAVGALGSFVTGSATASNVLFTSLQAQTAQALGLSTVTIVAAQNFGAGVGNIVCPHNIVAGAATVGLAGQEGQVLRRTLLPCLAYLLLGGALLMAWTAGG
ncbi:L-lactate permease [Ramlibacter sp. AW1]|uniref:L-lactate permease n=1 Tax=Ramlibacter aurantiacus TaxID=2801330 RepID=A0A937D4C8_9BURK|nr:L-lactate permease [Ramlibacter aurantiacus]MBL0420202.1 L-lactate permease [Ramlibacter aurantiacus]